MTTSKSATPRQLWALYCITKKDYRNQELSYEEASKLIKEFGDKNYVKKTKQNTVSLEEEFIEYFKEHALNEVVEALNKCLGITSEVVEDTKFMKGTGENGTPKRYKFYGFGCSISYLKYDKRSKLAKQIEEMFNKVHFRKCEELVLEHFSKELRDKLEEEGSPIEALYCQDYNVNSTLFYWVVEFAKSKGVKKITYVTNLD